ncbi:hypothetical protein [Burkholderia sp. Bp9143]|uniref:hypothetical protein n=1 Tax=Burkholderia sp. Bp9143 TaxID=2184574 RepID=UPI00162A3573|nr:hypothetical protein [Burkholderia sp. Bp9143]
MRGLREPLICTVGIPLSALLDKHSIGHLRMEATESGGCADATLAALRSPGEADPS